MFDSLGTVAVLDAEYLKVGDVIEIDGIPLVVEKIEDPEVYLQPLSGKALFNYRWKQKKIGMKILYAIVLIVFLFSSILLFQLISHR